MKRLLLAALVAASVFPGVGASYADHCPELPAVDPECELEHLSFGCAFDSVQQDDATGQNYEGAAYGYATDPTGAPVTIRCYITVNGVAAAGASVSGSGVGVAVAAGPISFEATADDDVEMCTEVNGNTVECGDSTNTQIPPQEVIDLISDLTSIPDPLLCPILAEIAAVFPDVPGVIEFREPDPDIYILGDLFWDCPPYEPETA